MPYPLARLNKDADDRWKRTNLLGQDDLTLAAKALDQAHSWNYRQKQPVESSAA